MTATVYATGIVHASAFAFDSRGRLWVAASGSSTHRRDGVTAPLGLVWSGGTLSIVSFNKDGSGLRVYARRIRAAFGLATDSKTGLLLASMNQRDDLGAKTPGDWLAIVHRGTDWRFPACYGQGGAVCKSVPAPTAVLTVFLASAGFLRLCSSFATSGASCFEGVDGRSSRFSGSV